MIHFIKYSEIIFLNSEYLNTSIAIHHIHSKRSNICKKSTKCFLNFKIPFKLDHVIIFPWLDIQTIQYLLRLHTLTEDCYIHLKKIKWEWQISHKKTILQALVNGNNNICVFN